MTCAHSNPRPAQSRSPGQSPSPSRFRSPNPSPSRFRFRFRFPLRFRSPSPSPNPSPNPSRFRFRFRFPLRFRSPSPSPNPSRFRFPLRLLLLPAVLSLALLAAIAVASPAWAFCRSTTCTGSKCATDDAGCPSSGAKLAWSGSCIGFSIEASGSRMIPSDLLYAAVRKSFKTWSQVDCGGGQFASITFAEQTPNFCDSAGYNTAGPNVNAVIFQDDNWKFKEENNVAKTSAHFDPKTGEILDADLEINTAVNLFTTDDNLAVTSTKYLDLQTVVTHEIGHMLGIAHSDRVDSIMFPLYMQGTLAGRKLTDDDVAAVCAVYPPNRKAVCDPTPRGGLDICRSNAAPSDSCSASAAAPWALWPALGLAATGAGIVVARRRRT